MTAPPGLSPAERTRLEELANVIAPAVGGMPSAREIALVAPDGLVDHVLAIRPALLLHARAALDTPPTESALDELAETAPGAFEALLELVASAYSLSDAVRARLGYRGQEALSLDRGRIGAEDELAKMMERAPFWRDAGDGTR